MAFSITQALYDWMHERRIVSSVAREMGMNENTLSAELRSHRSQAKLGADELIPLFEAIRRIGYGRELDGIIHQFCAALHNGTPDEDNDGDLVPHVLTLTKSLGILSECAARIPQSVDESELARVSIMLRTEVLPVILKMEDMVSARVKDLRSRRTKFTVQPVAETLQSGLDLG
jgi:hypothetical protein